VCEDEEGRGEGRRDEEEEEEEEMAAAAASWTWRKDMLMSAIRATMTKEAEEGLEEGREEGCGGVAEEGGEEAGRCWPQREARLAGWAEGGLAEGERGGGGLRRALVLEVGWRVMGRSHCTQRTGNPSLLSMSPSSSSSAAAAPFRRRMGWNALCALGARLCVV